jgi:hypothetical protein
MGIEARPACGRTGRPRQRQVDATVPVAAQVVPARANVIRSWSGQVPVAPQTVASVRVRAVSAGAPEEVSTAMLPDVLEGRIEPGKVFDRTVDLGGVPGYRAMDDPEALKVLVRP